MPTETIDIRLRDGSVHAATAEIARTSEGARTTKAAVIFFVSLALGAASIVIPLAHFFLPWLFPLVGGLIAWWVMRVSAHVARVTGTCPACGDAMEVPGGPVEDPMWRRCNRCQAPLQLLVKG